MKTETTPPVRNNDEAEFAERVRLNQSRLRVADGSIMPRVIAGNTMAPCVVIGERAAEMLKAQHGL